MNRVGLVIAMLCAALINTNLSAGIIPATTAQQETSEAKSQSKFGKLIRRADFAKLNPFQGNRLGLRLPSIRRIYSTIIPRDFNRKTVATYRSLGTNLFKVNKRGKSTYMLFAAPPLARDAMSRYITIGKENFQPNRLNVIMGFKLVYKLRGR